MLTLDTLKNQKNQNYLICKEINKRFNKYYDIGDYKFQYKDLDAVLGVKDDKHVILFGRVVNSRMPNNTTEDILNELLESSSLINLIDNSKKLAGRFVIVYYSNEGFFIIPDAASSIHIAYTTIGYDLYVSSNPKIIADINNFEESILSKEIKSSGAETHPLPYDMSMYDQIKFVIPNHFLNIETRTMTRYYPLSKIKKISNKNAAIISSELLGNIIKGYKNKFKLSIPLTSGMDSRTILSVCKNMINEIPTYTFFHDSFTKNTADILIPQQISNQYGFNYFVLKDLELPKELIEFYEEEIGKCIDRSEARNAWTYFNSELSEYKVLFGDISPLGKSNFGKNLPEFLATPSYLATKTHNFSKQNLKEVMRWNNDVKQYSKLSTVSKYDLFFWEHRVGKWTSNSYLNDDLLIEIFNPFNCRELIETWLGVPRKDRTRGEIHKAIIRLNWPELLDFPINPNDKYRLVYKNPILFYLASRVKFRLERISHLQA